MEIDVPASETDPLPQVRRSTEQGGPAPDLAVPCLFSSEPFLVRSLLCKKEDF